MLRDMWFLGGRLAGAAPDFVLPDQLLDVRLAHVQALRDRTGWLRCEMVRWSPSHPLTTNQPMLCDRCLALPGSK